MVYDVRVKQKDKDDDLYIVRIKYTYKMMDALYGNYLLHKLYYKR